MNGLLERWRIPLLVMLVLLLTSGGVLLANRLLAVPPPLVVTTPPPASRPIAVSVAGRVVSPGVYLLQTGQRVTDAIVAAGGPLPDADLAATTPGLAVRLKDEMQIVVPGQKTARPVGTPSAGSTPAGETVPRLVNLNTASLAELEALPRIGRVRAQRIVDSREREGPFQSIEDLLARKIVGPSDFQQIKALITAP